MSPLPLRVLPVPRETIPSFLGRMAAVNGLSAREFAIDMGFNLRKVINLDPVAIGLLAERGGLDEAVFEDTISWTGRSIGDVRMQFRGEVLVSRAIRNPVVRGCPQCLREDAETHPDAPRTFMAMRGDWQFRDVSICLRHGHILVPLWRASKPLERYDIGARLSEIRDGLLDRNLEREQVAASAYDRWLDRRLETGSDDTHLASYALIAATTFCRLLGAELLRHDGGRGTDEDRAAQAAGFDVACRGESAIRDALEALLDRATGAQFEPRVVFGNLYSKLAHDYAHDPDFSRFRDLLRDCILAAWPIAAGETVLGQGLPRRLLHSIYSAEKETGIWANTLELVLEEVGAIAPDDTRLPNRKTFDAERFAGLLAEIPHWVGTAKLRAAMGATQNELDALIAGGILVPATAAPGIKFPWRITDGLALVEELLALSGGQAEGDKWETLQMAAKRKRHAVATLIAAIREGVLELRVRPGEEGYHAFVVNKNEVNALSRRLGPNVGQGAIPAVVFAQTIARRGRDRFLTFLADGHSPSVRLASPNGGPEEYALRPEDIDAFHARFVTLPMLVERFGTHRNTILAQLRAAEIRPFAPEGKDYGHIYLRQDVERAFGEEV